ncbi:MAG: GntR family transcriptional regulator [Anaerolineae bacterium]|nr:GntR family transcriptional regulator [Anaerolineae bacterium]
MAVATLKHDGIPLYVQLEEIFAERIAIGEWAVNETIPNEMALCKEFQVSRGPVRQALDHLVRKGLLHRKQGKGTMVLPPKVENHLSDFYSFTKLIERRNKQPTIQLLSFDTVPAEKYATNYLKLSAGSNIFKLRRLRLADNEPLIAETIYLPYDICPELSPVEVVGPSLYELLRERYGVNLVHSKHYFEPTVANEFEAGVLGVTINTPMLLLETITYTYGDHPIVFSKAVMRGDRVRYYVELNAPIDSP